MGIIFNKRCENIVNNFYKQFEKFENIRELEEKKEYCSSNQKDFDKSRTTRVLLFYWRKLHVKTLLCKTRALKKNFHASHKLSLCNFDSINRNYFGFWPKNRGVYSVI